eukprot:scaffold23213_cov90-Phaeocystis_antarctica.AAC.2
MLYSQACTHSRDPQARTRRQGARGQARPRGLGKHDLSPARQAARVGAHMHIARAYARAHLRHVHVHVHAHVICTRTFETCTCACACACASRLCGCCSCTFTCGFVPMRHTDDGLRDPLRQHQKGVDQEVGPEARVEGDARARQGRHKDPACGPRVDDGPGPLSDQERRRARRARPRRQRVSHESRHSSPGTTVPTDVLSLSCASPFTGCATS